MLEYIILGVFFLGLGIAIPIIIRKLSEKSRIMQIKQAEGVYHRLLNDSTAAFTKDIMTVRVGGLEVIDGANALKEAFPNLIESLEKTRKKNPEAWFRIIQQWLPLIMMKQNMQAQANKALGDLAGPVGVATQAAGPGLMQGVLDGMMGGKIPGPPS